MAEKTLSPNDIILGAGELYLTEFTGTTVPEHATIETDANNVGHTSGGATFTYTPTVYDVENSYGKVVKRKITKTECVFKSGILTFDPEKIGLLTNAKITKDTNKTKITYEVTDADLNIYKQSNSYVPGKRDPFSMEETQPTGNATGGTSTNNEETVETNTNSDPNSTGTFFNDTGKK